MNEFCKTTVVSLNQTLPLLHFINVNASLLVDVCHELETSESDSAIQAKYSKPMVYIAYYIGFALNLCFMPMLLDLMQRKLQSKFWVPCKHMSLNAASITIIAVVIKLPMDLTSPMPDKLDQFAKVGSLGFLCTVLSHVMPSLGSMNTNSLISNVTALAILVITLIVNVGIQLKTGVINGFPYMIIACIYMGMLFFLLIIFVASSITIPTFKRVLEFKYQANLTSEDSQQNLISTVEELSKLVTRYWIMTETSNPQFVMASTPLCSASSMICLFSMLVYIYLICTHLYKTSSSVYGHLSTQYIIGGQLCGVVCGSVTSLLRSFSVLRFKLLANQYRNHISVFRVEKYWTRRRSQWKQSNLSLLVYGIDFRVIKLIQIIWTGFDKVVVVRTHKVVVILCKIIELIPIMVIIFAICISRYFKLLKQMLFIQPTALSSEDIDEEHINCVLLLENDDQLAKHLLKRSLESLCKVLGTKVPQNNLMKLLEKSVAFDGVENFDTDQIQPLLPIELVNSWSLPIISLACIAIAIPSIDKDLVDNLVKSVGEGLFFTGIVEESLNKESEYLNIQRATMSLWVKVKDKRKAGKTPTYNIRTFANSAEEILNEFKRSTNEELIETENLPRKVIIANSIYRTAKTIIHTYESNNLEIIEEELFSRLSAMIADIFAACFTNLPRLIIMLCHERRIEKREASVRSAVILLKQASKIIKRLETRELPNMNPDKMAYIDEWRLHFKQP